MFASPAPSVEIPDGLETWLVDNHLPIMKRLLLMADMGNIDVTPANGEKCTFTDITHYWAAKAMEWPLADTVHGIEVGEWLAEGRARKLVTTPEYLVRQLPEDQMSSFIAKGVAGRIRDALAFLPKSFKTDEIIDIALNNNAGQIGYVPVDKITPERMRLAIAQDPGNFIRIPASSLTDEIIDLAISRRGENLLHVQDDQRTAERVMLALASCPWLIGHLNPEQITHQQVIQAVSHDGLTLDEIPADKVTREACLRAIKNDPHALPLAPEPFLDAGLVRHALKHHPEVAQEGWFQKVQEDIAKRADSAPTR